jgi:2-keto-myo-inositol isomerase
VKLCFNQATTMKKSTLETDLQFCEQYGYDLIEIRLDKLKDYLKIHQVSDLVAFFKSAAIKPYAFNALENITFRGPDDYRQIKDDLKFLCEIGAKINCKQIVVVPSFDIGAYTRTQIKEESVRVLHELADHAEKYGMKLAYEFVGYPNCSVNTFGQTYEIVKAVNRDSVGMVLDCFHFYAMGSRIEDLKLADPQKIFIFHIDDAEDLPIGALRDEQRLWPGDGVIDLDAILKTLRAIGYDEMVSVELFRPEYWDWEIEKAIRVGKEKTAALAGKYFRLGRG